MWGDGLVECSVHFGFRVRRDAADGERAKGATAAPLAIPAAPQRNRCCALRSPPARLPAVGSIRPPASFRLWPPSLAASPCHPASGSPVSAGTQPLASLSLFFIRRQSGVSFLNLQEPQCRVYKIVWKCAGVRLKIAEAFPAGRGSPHGCGLRARLAGTLHRARPEAGRDKPKAPRSGDFLAGSPGVQGAAATGRPLRALCAWSQSRTQKPVRAQLTTGQNHQRHPCGLISQVPGVAIASDCVCV